MLIDSRAYTSQLPGSIAAVVFFDDASEDGRLDRANEQARIEATKAYVLLLDKYDLREADLPLLKISRPDPAHADRPQQKVRVRVRVRVRSRVRSRVRVRVRVRIS